MGIFNRFKNYVFEKRNAAIATVMESRTPGPVYTNWTIEKAVKEGYKSNPWVYRSVYLKAKAGSSVPWFVQNKEGEKQELHHLTKLFDFPNPNISRQDLFELVISWLELAGNSYLKKAGTANETVELWPMSPDRIHPVPSKDPEEWSKGFAFDKSRTATYMPHEVIHHKYFNPANPLLGIAPLESVSKTVDIDTSQKDFNKSTSQNRGIVDGVFTFDRNFNDQTESDAVANKLNERHSGKRSFGVLGSNAKYIRTALTPAEMDFILSGKANREEIFIAFGVPPVYAGVMDGATMNNYKTSELVFWFGTMLFLLDDLKDTFNFSFKNELKPGEKIVYDLTGVPAIREAMLAKTKTAQILFDMGVPFEQLNKVFSLGFEEFEDWSKSNVKNGGSSDQPANDSATRKSKYTFIEKRKNDDLEEQISKRAEKNSAIFKDLLSTQQETVFDLIDSNMEDGDFEKKILESRGIWEAETTKMIIDSGVYFGQDMVLEQRSIEDDLTGEIENYLQGEASVLKQISLINATTVNKVIDHVRSALDNGQSANELQQSLVDSGIFSESRALMLARTITGTAANLGQMQGAKLGGADWKEWSTAGFEVRKTHQKMEGVRVPVDEFFLVGKKKERAMFP